MYIPYIIAPNCYIKNEPRSAPFCDFFIIVITVVIAVIITIIMTAFIRLRTSGVKIAPGPGYVTVSAELLVGAGHLTAFRFVYYDMIYYNAVYRVYYNIQLQRVYLASLSSGMFGYVFVVHNSSMPLCIHKG